MIIRHATNMMWNSRSIRGARPAVKRWSGEVATLPPLRTEGFPACRRACIFWRSAWAGPGRGVTPPPKPQAPCARSATGARTASGVNASAVGGPHEKDIGRLDFPATLVDEADVHRLSGGAVTAECGRPRGAWAVVVAPLLKGGQDQP